MAAQYLVTALADTRIVFDLAYISEVAKGGDCIPVPGAAAWIGGLAYLRGRILPVIDLAVCLGINRAQKSSENKGMNVIVAHDRTLYSFQVDAVFDTVSIAAADMQSLPPHLGAAWQRFGAGVYPYGDELLVVLDTAALLESLCTGR